MAKANPPFTPAAIKFLRDLRQNNAREWFQPRKDQFEELVRLPMLNLCDAVADGLRSFAVDHVVPAKKAMKRIYRDVRFSKDKTPYKTGVSALFPRAGMGKDRGAIYYFGVSPDGVRAAVGLYNPDGQELAAVRQEIDQDTAAFKKLTAAPSLVRLFGPMQGDQLVRPVKGFPADHPAADLLRRKQFYFATLLPVALATQPALAKTLVDHFKTARPFVEHLNRLLITADLAANGETDDRPQRPKPMF